MDIVPRDTKGRFGAGNPGRPKGSRNRSLLKDHAIGKRLGAALDIVFEVLESEDGTEQLRGAVAAAPLEYLKLAVGAAKLLPESERSQIGREAFRLDLDDSEERETTSRELLKIMQEMKAAGGTLEEIDNAAMAALEDVET